jgi:hypothetical protein
MQPEVPDFAPCQREEHERLADKLAYYRILTFAIGLIGAVLAVTANIQDQRLARLTQEAHALRAEIATSEIGQALAREECMKAKALDGAQTVDRFENSVPMCGRNEVYVIQNNGVKCAPLPGTSESYGRFDPAVDGYSGCEVWEVEGLGLAKCTKYPAPKAAEKAEK